MRKVFRLVAAAAVLAAAAVTVSTNAAKADDAQTVGLSYKFFLGGVFLGKATLNAQLGANSYETSAWLEADGVADWFVDAVVTTRATGGFERGAPAPASFDADAVADGERRLITIAYGGAGPSSVVADPPFDPRPWQLDPTQQRGALDPMSAIVAAMRPENGEVCNRTIPVYDGRRRYDVVFESELRSEMEGRVRIVECEARLKRVAGFKPKHLALPDYEFRVRFAVRPNGVAIPVRAWGDTAYGAAMMRLR